ncbi:chorismate synthase [Thermopetrobacter sp. TC1]|uniref:chorismate synthase n=1 Tax=Thermopetrobacter sp. TC1 TaxID=1495045 RepID=UPI00056E5A4C|nr:chorismate synthase [Thermopetrobacter sp. TC1]
MSYNTFGRILRMTTFGESHGPAIGAVLDGCPPGIPLNEEMIQPYLDRRRPGQSRYTTQRREPDKVRILSGVFQDEGMEHPVTTGTPIALLIENTDQRSKDYSEIREKFRPGHADLTYQMKYGIRDYRGGGRASARETAARVAAGAVARRIIPQVTIRGALVQMGPHKIDRARFSWEAVEENPFFCPDPEMAEIWADYLDDIRKKGDSVGGVVEVVASGVPAGWGAPVYAKLDQDIAAAMMSIPAVKGVEIGAGFAAAAMTGSEAADEMEIAEGSLTFSSNHSGGILGGISSGQDIVVRLAVKPTSSILVPRRTVTRTGENTEIVTKGRHDPCVGIRAVPVAEAMLALVLADHFLLHRAQIGREGAEFPT